MKALSASKSTLEWTHADVDVLLDSGIAAHVTSVAAARDSRTGRLFFDPVSALARYYEEKAREAGLQELRDASLLSLLIAPIGGIDAPWVLRKYSLNKMLFYQWKRAESQGLAGAVPHDEFIAERKGPVPVHIDEDLLRLENAGFLEVQRHDPNSEVHVPWKIEITAHGREAARRFFDSAETWFRRATIETKKDLLFLDPAKLRARVHSEFPQYRRKYIEIDDS